METQTNEWPAKPLKRVPVLLAEHACTYTLTRQRPSATLIATMARWLTLWLFLAISQCWFTEDAWASSINLVQNGNFSAGSSATQFCSNYPGNTPPCVTDNLPLNWGDSPPSPANASSLNVVTQGAEPIAAPSGYTGNYVAFTSAAASGQDCLFQDLPTVVGAMYTLSFDLAVVGASTNLYMAPEWESGSNDPTFYGLGNGAYSSGPPFAGLPVTSSGSVPFQPFSLQVLAESTNTTLWFHAVDNGGAILLANVSVTQDSAAPEPESLWLIAGGLITLLLCVRLKRTVSR